MDYLGYRKRIGIVVPSTNTIVQPESDDLRLRGVTNHIARISIKERPLKTEQAFLEHVEAMRSGMRGAIDQMMTSQGFPATLRASVPGPSQTALVMVSIAQCTI